jgi:predicted nucleic acid-binding protein
MIAVDSSVWIDFLNGNDTREVARLRSSGDM